LTEADTCRTYVLPKRYDAGWTDEQIREQVTFSAGRIVPAGSTYARKPGRPADYLLRYRPDLAIAVVEAKAEYKEPGDGLQQAMDYADTLGVRFAYSTNGLGIVVHNYTTGQERELGACPSRRPARLTSRASTTWTGSRSGSWAQRHTSLAPTGTRCAP
jgi:type I restriction enzyme R subunit